MRYLPRSTCWGLKVRRDTAKSIRTCRPFSLRLEAMLVVCRFGPSAKPASASKPTLMHPRRVNSRNSKTSVSLSPLSRDINKNHFGRFRGIRNADFSPVCLNGSAISRGVTALRPLQRPSPRPMMGGPPIFDRVIASRPPKQRTWGRLKTVGRFLASVTRFMAIVH